MNWLLLLAGALSFAVLAGHLTVGRKQFLLPVLGLEGQAPLFKKGLHGMFHVATATFVVLAGGLLGLGLGVAPLGAHAVVLAPTIGLFYGSFAAVYLVLASTSGIPGALGKMFQWIIFLAVAVLSVLGGRA